MAFTDEQVKKIADALNALGANLPCPRCNTNVWGLIDGFVNPMTSSTPGHVVLGGSVFPTVVTVCSNCGYLTALCRGSGSYASRFTEA